MPLSRPLELHIGEKVLPLPNYFPSISSVKTAIKPYDYLTILSSLSAINKQYLVSAFDLAEIENPTMAARMLSDSRASGAITLMDSGNYESFWKNEQKIWTQPKFHRMLRAFPCDMAFAFDEQKPPSNSGEHIELLAGRWHEDQEAADKCVVVPIVHGEPVQLPTLCAALARTTGVQLIAVPERRLGDGITERAHTVAAIRRELEGLGHYVALHLLGTGNPISIALYSSMGADSFDGLEWCQTVVDHDTALLYHLSQTDFFAHQTDWDQKGLSYQARTLAHNLDFYRDWMHRLRSAIKRNDAVGFCRHNFPNRIFRHCASILNEAPK